VSRSHANSALSGNHQRRTAKIHRSVWWCTRLSGESTVSRGNGRPRIPRVTRGRANGHIGAPDCPVCTGLSGVHRTVSGAPTALRLQWSASPNKESNLHRTVNSGCPVVHRTVRCASRQKARSAFQECFQRLLAALGL
jgi:hypothetical protein